MVNQGEKMSNITRNWTGLGYNGNINDPDNWTPSSDISGNVCYYGDTWGDTLIIGEYEGSHAPNYLDLNIYGQLSVPIRKLDVKKTFRGDLGYVGQPLVVNLTGTSIPPGSEYVTSCSNSIFEIPDFKTFVQTNQESYDYANTNDFDSIIYYEFWKNALIDDRISSLYKYYLASIDIDIGNPNFDYQGGTSGQGGSALTTLPFSSSSSSSSSALSTQRNIYIKVLDSIGNGYWNCKNRSIKSLNYVTIRGLGMGKHSQSNQLWNTFVNLEGDIFYLNTSKYAGLININNCEVFNIRHDTDTSVIWHPTQSNYETQLILKLRDISVNSTQPVSDLDPYDAYGTGCVLNEILESNNELTDNGNSVGYMLGTNKTNFVSHNFQNAHFVECNLCGHFSNIFAEGLNHIIKIGNSQINGLLGFSNQIKVDKIYWQSRHYLYDTNAYPWGRFGGFNFRTRATVDSIHLLGGALQDYPASGYPTTNISREYETTINSLLLDGGGLALQFDSINPKGINVDRFLFSPALTQANGVKLLSFTSIKNSVNTNTFYLFIGDNRPAVDSWNNYHYYG